MEKRLYLITILVAVLVLNMIGSSSLNFFVPTAQAVPVQDGIVAQMISKMNQTEIYNTAYALQNFTTRVYGSSGNVAAATYLYNRLSDISGLSVEYQSDYNNIVATLPGVDLTSSATYVVGAHYDSISDNESFAPGASDNGAGVAVVLEFARIMSQYRFNHTIKFALWNAEEQVVVGSYERGSLAYAEYANSSNINVSLYMNLDAICYDPYNQMMLDIVSNNQSTWVSNIMTSYNTLYGINLTLTYNAKLNDGSDHRSFWTYGYPAVWMHSETYGPIHTEWDTIERVSAAYAEKNGQLSMSVLAALARGVAAPPTPTPTPTATPTPTPTATPTPTGKYLSYNMEIADNATVYETSIGDVDGDGFNDIIGAVEHVGLSYYSYPNWDKHTIYSFDYVADDLDSGDIDNDGSLDVVGVQNNTEVYWFDNSRSTANWTRYFIGSTGSTPTSTSIVRNMKIVDFNGDRKLDVIIRTPTTTRIYLQVTPTSWNNIKTISHSFVNWQADTINIDGLDVGDIDKDGDLDVVLNGFWVETPSDLSGGLWAQHSIDSKWYNQNLGGWEDNNAKVVVVDINKDGYLDVIFSQNERAGFPVSWYETSNPKNGVWVEHVIGFVDFCHTLEVGDLNNDGYLDVVAGEMERHEGFNSGPFSLYVFFNDGSSQNWIKQEVSTVGIYSGVIGDIGNDGLLDIVGVRSYWKGPLQIWRGYYSSTPVPTSTPTPTVTPSSTPVPTSTPTPTVTPSPSQTLTPTATSTPNISPLPSPTPIPSSTPISTVTQIPLPTPTSTRLFPPSSSFSPTSSPNPVHSEFPILAILPIFLVMLTPAIVLMLRKRNDKN